MPDRGSAVEDCPTVADPRTAQLALLGMVNHTAQWFRPRGELAPDQIAAGFTALVLH